MRTQFSRRTPLIALVLLFMGCVAVWELATTEVLARAEVKAIAIGARRELLVDDFLIDKMDDVKLKLHRPAAGEVVITCDAPWEGNTSAYFTIFQDKDRYRMYYRGSHANEKTKKFTHPEYACYAESRDGLKWEKPKLGLFASNGSKENNIVWSGIGTHNFTPFRDENPDCPAKARYKAFGVGYPARKGDTTIKRGLYAFQSADGIHWSLMSKEPVITEGAFDSQNLAFWDKERKCYFAYHRHFTNGVRAIMVSTSKDFLKWTKPKFLEYGKAPKEHLYTNAIRPYFRAPHLFLGFPTRFQPKTQQVEPIFMTSRDGFTFNRWSEELIPITAPKDRDGNRSNYMTRGLVQLPGKDREMSVYATEAYYAGPGSRVRRFVYRVDGFVSASAGAKGGTLITKPITFTGAKLHLNIASKGTSRVEIQDADGKVIRGFALADCKPIKGDFIDQAVTWKTGDLATLAGKPVRLRFALNDADLYSFVVKPAARKE